MIDEVVRGPESAELPWRDRAFVPLARAAEILSLSRPSVYKLEKQGRLRFHRVAGRTLVSVPSLIALSEAAGNWSASARGAEGRASRVRREG
jgi:predicted DNA-binding transcriptional regulator AlpA